MRFTSKCEMFFAVLENQYALMYVKKTTLLPRPVFFVPRCVCPMTTATLDVLTLNTWGFAWPLAKHRAARFGRIAEHLQAETYDVVALQELWGGAREVLGETGMEWALDDAQAERGLRQVDSGLGLKVRRGLHRGVEVMRDLVRAFRVHAGFDRWKSKGFVGLQVPAGDVSPVAIVNTHLQAGQGAARVRREQLEHVLASLSEVEIPTIICGDFNLFTTSAEDRAGHDQLARNGFRDASELIDRPDATYLARNMYVGGMEDHRFDRIYLRDGVANGRRVRIHAEDVRVIVDHEAPLSDHEAVAARIRVEACP